MRTTQVIFLIVALAAAQSAKAELTKCPSFVGEEETLLGTFNNLIIPGQPETLIRTFSEQHPWSCCKLCKQTQYCEYFTWKARGQDGQEVPLGDCLAFNGTVCSSNDPSALPFETNAHGAYSGSISQCEKPEEKFLRKALLVKREALEAVHDILAKPAKLSGIVSVARAELDQLVEEVVHKRRGESEAETEEEGERRILAEEATTISVEDNLTYEDCPDFSTGQWAVGRLRNLRSPQGEMSKMRHQYHHRSPRACCNLCTGVVGCGYWSWEETDPQATKGTCHLYHTFACEKNSNGLQPFEGGKSRWRTGAGVCKAPVEIGRESVDEVKLASMGEVGAALAANVARKEEQLVSLANEEKVANEARAAAEKLAEEDKKAVGDAELAEEAAKIALQLAVAAEKDAAARLVAAQAAKTDAERQATEQAAVAQRALEKENEIAAELKAASLAKASSDNLKISEFMIDHREKRKKERKNPFRHCPAFEDSSWKVGSLRSGKDANGVDSKLGEAITDVKPKDCCEACAAATGCEFWSWQGAEMGAISGTCTLFTASGCSADSSGLLPFDHTDHLARVGKPTCSLPA